MSVHRDLGLAFLGNKHHIWWECRLKKKKKPNKNKSLINSKPEWVDPTEEGRLCVVCSASEPLPAGFRGPGVMWWFSPVSPSPLSFRWSGMVEFHRALSDLETQPFPNLPGCTQPKRFLF